MHIRHHEQIFSIDKVVPVELFPVFWQILLQCYLSRCVFYGSLKIPCRSPLLSTTILNDIQEKFEGRKILPFVGFTQDIRKYFTVCYLKQVMASFLWKNSICVI